MRNVSFTYLTVLSFALMPIASLADEVNLLCKGKLTTLDSEVPTREKVQEGERTFVIKDNTLYAGENIVKCSSNESMVRCYKQNEQGTQWKFEVNRISGKVFYLFTTKQVEVWEKFEGECRKVRKVF